MTRLLHHPQFKDAGDYLEAINGEPVLVSRLLVDNTTTHIDKDGSNNMTFTDVVTGMKTLAQLATGAGGVDTSGTPVANDMARFTDADTIEGRSYSEVVSDILPSFADQIDKTHLSQDFGASAGRLRNFLIEPISGEIIRILNGAQSAFTGAIHAAGTGGLTATNVPYDGDSNEDMFNGLAAYDGSSYWGQIILHNTTRSNSRKIVSVDRTNNAITTSSSTDDWADNDVITCSSQTNAQAGYFDVDVSDNIPVTTDAIFLSVVFRDNEGNADTNRVLYFHPYTTYNTGKRVFLPAVNANDQNNGVIPIKIISQKLTMSMYIGCADITLLTSVCGYAEYADT